MTAEAYPLYWPPTFKRTKSPTSSRFQSTINAALNGVREELNRLGKDTGKNVTDVIISSNVTLGEHRPKDAGVAVWFTWGDMQVCFPCDRYQKVEDNLRAIALIIESHRTIMRHGGLHILEATFRGFSALPPPRNADGTIEGPKPWRVVLGVKADHTPTEAELKAIWKNIAKARHPDTGGTAAAFNEAQAAYQQGLQEVR